MDTRHNSIQRPSRRTIAFEAFNPVKGSGIDAAVTKSFGYTVENLNETIGCDPQQIISFISDLLLAMHSLCGALMDAQRMLDHQIFASKCSTSLSGERAVRAARALGPGHRLSPAAVRGVALAAANAADDRPPQQQQQRRNRGAGYYERYLRNRRKRGGEFIAEFDPASPPPPTAWLPQLSDEPLDRGSSALKHGNAAGGTVMAPSPWPEHAALLERVVREAVEAYRLAPPPQVQRARDTPDRLRDRVPDSETEAFLSSIKPRDGLVIGPPELQAAADAASYPLPQLPAVAEAQLSGERVEVYVFWDVSSVHPRALDSRVVVWQLRRVMEAVGELSGLYAYGTRKQLAWVPEVLMRRYAPERLLTPGARRAVQQPFAQQQQQQRFLGGDGPDGRTADGAVEAEPGYKLRCPICGRASRSYQVLQQHMGQVHKRRAPPLDQVERLPISRASGVDQQQQQQQRQHQQSKQQKWQRQQADSPTSASSSAASAIAASWDGSLVNTAGRTLGKVAAYTSSEGAVYAPRGGVQVSLKYVLAREGCETRLVQNDREAVDESLADGMLQLLESLEGRTAEEVGTGHVVIVVVSDSPTHAQLLARARQIGCSTVVVCDQRARYPEADLILRWRLLVAGRYDVGA